MPPSAWAGFLLLVGALLMFELAVFPRAPHVVRLREAEGLALLWLGVGAAFGIIVTLSLGSARGAEYAVGYLKSLDIGHIFAFSLVFGVFGLPRALERRVLFWGVVVALTFRLVVVLAGSAVIERNRWLLPLFGLFLLVAAVRTMRHDDVHVHGSAMRVAGWASRVAGRYDAEHFIARIGRRRVLTRLALVLFAIELTDLLFSVDSLPGLLGMSREPFVVYTSNALATVTLRALYFVLADLRDRFRFWRIGLAATLGFVGLKLLLAGVVTVDPLASLAVIAAILAGTVAASWALPALPGAREPTAESEEATGREGPLALDSPDRERP